MSCWFKDELEMVIILENPQKKVENMAVYDHFINKDCFKLFILSMMWEDVSRDQWEPNWPW